ncbi:hypothetical protein CC80DRAFT_491986 [Byssothecium circinans]|uniref:Uncharacterized protein n=1 Tax=Byssothecium circinans TaxID=147558 RepID=A0A6A5TX31_9PLEO|nr:hypothetical protein CC80DRAFT_491986 [Byssothecium circinans]
MPFLYTRLKELTPEQRAVVHMYPPPNEMYNTTHRKYKYELQAPQRDHDPVKRAIIRAIFELRKENIQACAAAVSAQGLTLNPPIWPLNEQNQDTPFEMYAFKKRFEEFPSGFGITIKDRWDSRPLTADRVFIRASKVKAWRPIKEWLVDWTFSKEYPSGSPALTMNEAQRKWWTCNGKYFPILELPCELRLNILEYVLGENIRPHTTRDGGEVKVVLGFGRVMWETVPRPNYAIFGVNKQLHDEALRVGWTYSQKHFHYFENLRDVVLCPNPPTAPRWLSNVTLHFSISDLFGMLDLKFSETGTLEHEPKMLPRKIFEDMTTLETLTLDFPSPYESCNSWREVLEPYLEKKYKFGWIREYPCWKVLVDWLMTFLYPLLKDIPRVRHPVCRPPECFCPQSCYYDTNVHDQRHYGIPLGTRAFDHDDRFYPIKAQEENW